jgi:hypothetical protein
MAFRIVWPAAAVALGLTLGCASNPNEPTPLPLAQPFELRVGATVSLENDLTVTFLQVNSDSRCPTNATCVRAGEAVITVAVSQPSRTPGISTTVVTSINIPPLPGTCSGPAARSECVLATIAPGSIATQGAFDIRLIQLAPYPQSATAIRREDYVATLTVTIH